jgi:hypothetical protein
MNISYGLTVRRLLAGGMFEDDYEKIMRSVRNELQIMFFLVAVLQISEVGGDALRRVAEVGAE